MAASREDHNVLIFHAGEKAARSWRMHHNITVSEDSQGVSTEVLRTMPNGFRCLPEALISKMAISSLLQAQCTS